MSSAQTCPKSRVIQKIPFDRPTFLRDCGLQVLSTDSTADSRNKLLYMNKKKMIKESFITCFHINLIKSTVNAVNE